MGRSREKVCWECGKPQQGHGTAHEYLELCTAGGLTLPCDPLQPDDCLTCEGTGKDDRYGWGRSDWNYCTECDGTGKKKP